MKSEKEPCTTEIKRSLSKARKPQFQLSPPSPISPSLRIIFPNNFLPRITPNGAFVFEHCFDIDSDENEEIFLG